MAAHAAEQLKEKGNVAFRDGDYEMAEDWYTQAIHRYSGNAIIFTNRANARLKLQRWEDAMNDSLKSIEISGEKAQSHKAYYYLAQAQLSLHHPHEALSSALTAYEQVLHPRSAAAKISPKDLTTFSEFVLKCKKAKYAFLLRERERRKGDLLAELEAGLETAKQTELDQVSAQLRDHSLGPIAAAERSQEITASFNDKIGDLRAIFTAAGMEPAAPREIPDHLVDSISLEPMHDPVITKNGHSYERSTIVEHLKRTPTDPLTRDPLSMDDLRSNFGLKAACDEFWNSGSREWKVD